MTAADQILIWGLGLLCLAAIPAIIGFGLVGRYPVVRVVEPEPVDGGPVHHASDEMAAWHNHRPRHTGELPPVDAEVYNSRAWHLDEATGPIMRPPITAEYEVVRTAVMGQGPFIVAEPLPAVPYWFSDERVPVGGAR